MKQLSIMLPAIPAVKTFSSGILQNLHRVLVAVMFCSTLPAMAADRTWVGNTSTDWNTASNWSGNTVPVASDVVFVNTGSFAPVFPTSTNLSLQGLTVAAGATLTLTSSSSLTVNGPLTNNGSIVSGSGTCLLYHTGTNDLSGTGTFGSNVTLNITGIITLKGNINIAGTVDIAAGATLSADPGVVVNSTTSQGTITSTTSGGGANIWVTGTDFQSQYKFTTRSLANTTVVYGASGNQTINLSGIVYGDLAVAGTGTKTLGAAVTTTNVTGDTLRVLSGATLATGSVAIGCPANRTIIVDANSSISAGTSTITFGTGTKNLIVSGTIVTDDVAGFYGSTSTTVSTTNTPSITLNTGSTIAYSSAVGQTVSALTYSNLLLYNGSTKTGAAGTITVNGTFTIGANTTFTMGSSSTLSGTLTSISIDNTSTINSVNALPSNQTWGGTVQYSSVSTSVAGGNYYNLTLNGTNTTAAGNISVDQTLQVSSGVTFDLQTYTLGGNLTSISNANIIKVRKTDGPALPQGKLWTGTVDYAGNGNQEAAGGTYTNLTISNTGGVVTANESIAIQGALRTSPDAILNMGSYAITGAVNTSGTGNLGTIRTSYVGYDASNNPIPAVPSGVNWNNVTIEFANPTGSQHIPNGTYTKLIISNTSGTQTALSGTIGITSSLSTVSGGTLNLGTSRISIAIGGTVSAKGRILISRTVDATALTSGLAWGHVEYNGASDQTIVSGTYDTLVLSGSSRTVSVGTNTITVNNKLSVNAGVTLNIGSSDPPTFSVGKNAVVDLSGTAQYGGTGTLSISDVTWGGSGTFVYNRSGGGQQIVSGTYNHLTLSNTSGTQTATGNINVSGILTLSNTASTFDLVQYYLGGTLTSVANAGSIKTASTSTTPLPSGKTWGGTIVYANTTGGQTVVPGTYGNLTLNNTSGNQTAGGNLTVNGTLTVSTGGTLNLGTNTLAGTLTTVDNNGTITTTSTSSSPLPSNKTWSGTVVYANTTGGQTVVSGTYGNLTLNNTSGTLTTNGDITVNTSFTATGGIVNLGTYNLLGNPNTFSCNANIITTSASTNPLPSAKTWGASVTYSKADGGQQIVGGTYSNLTIGNTSGTQTASGNLAVNNTFTTTLGGTFNLGSYTLGGTPSSIINFGTLITTNTSATPLPAGNTWGGTIAYANTTGGQTVVTGTYGNLTLSNTSGNQTAGGNLTVNGTLTVSTGGTLNLGTNTLAGTLATVNNNGTISTTSTSSSPLPSDKTWSGTVVYANTTGGQTVVSGTYGNLTLNNTSGNQTAGGNLTVNGSLTVSPGGTLNLGTNTLAGTLATVVNNGTISTTSTSSSPLPSGKTWGGTIVYANTTGGQTVVSGTYGNLTLNNTSGTLTTNGDITVNGTLTHSSASSTFDLDQYVLSGTLTSVANTGTIRTANSTSATPLPSGKTWGGAVAYANSNGGQTVVSGTYTNLTMGNSSGTQNVTANLSVSGTLTTTAGGTLNLGNNVFSVFPTTLTNNGTIATVNTTTTPLPSGKTWGGTVSYANATGGQTIVSGTYTNLRLEHASGTQSAADSITVTTNFTATGAGSVNLGVYSLKGDPTVAMNSTSTLQTASTSYTSLPSGKSWNGTVQYSRTNGGQILVSGTFANLTLSNTTGTQTAAGPVTVNGTLTTTAGGTLNLNYQPLSGTLTTITNNGTIRTTASANPPLPVNKTWGGTVVYDSLAGGQHIAYGTYNNLTLSNTSGTHTATAGTITVNGTLTTTGGGTFNLGTNILSLGGLSTVANNGTISTANTSTTPLPSGKTWGGTISYANTSGGQTVVDGTYTHLRLENSSGGFQTATGDITVNTSFYTASGGGFNLQTYDLLGNPSSFSCNGSILTASLSTSPLPAGKTWGGTVTYSTSANAQTIVGGAYTNLAVLSPNATLTVTGDLAVTGQLSNSGTLNMGNNLFTSTPTGITNNGTIATTNTSSTPLPAGLNWGGTISYNNATGGQTVVSGTYTNLTMGNSSGTQNVAANLSVSGALTTTAGGTLNMGNYLFTSTPTGITNNGTIATTNTSSTPLPTGRTWGGTVSYANAAGGQTIVSGTYANLRLEHASGTQSAADSITVNTNFTTTGAGSVNLGVYSLKGDPTVTMNSTSTLQTASTSYTSLPSGKSWDGSVQYNRTSGGQIIVSGTFANLTLSNTTGTQTVAGSVTVNGTLTTTAGGTLNLNYQPLSGTLTTIANNGTIRTTASANPPLPENKTWGGTVVYDSLAGGQNIAYGTYNNLTLSNTSGTHSATAGTITVNGTLTTTGGGTFNLGTNLLSLGGLSTVANNGTISTANTSATPLPSGKTWGGTISYANTSGGQTVVSGTYTHLTLGNSSGTQNVAADLSVSGTLTTAAGGTLNLGNNVFSVFPTTLSNNGTITTANNTTTPLPSGITWGGTIVYGNSTGGQTIVAGTYNNLTLSNASGTQSAAGNLVVNGTFTIVAGSTFSLGPRTLTGSLTPNNSGTITISNRTSQYPIPDGKTWGGSVYYTSVSAQNISGGTYKSLYLNAAGNNDYINDAKQEIIVTDSLTIGKNCGIKMGNFALQLGANTVINMDNNGKIITTNQTTTPLPANLTWGGRIEYANTTGGQTVVNGSYLKLTVSNTSGTQTAGGAITVRDTLITTAGGTLDFGSNDLSGSLTTVTNNGTIRTNSLSTTPLPSGKTWGGTVSFVNMSGGQTIVGGTFTHLTMGNSSGTQNVAADLSVNGTLTTTAGGTLNLGNNVLSLGGSGTIANNGTISTANTSATPLPSGKTWGGTISYANTSGGQTVVSGTYTHLTMGNSSGTQNVAADLSVSGTLTTAAGGTLNLGNNVFSVFPTTLSNNGTITTANTTTTPLPSGKTWGGTISYANTTGGQTVVAGTYTHLTMGNSSGTQNVAADLSVSGTLTTTAGGTLNLGDYVFSVFPTTLTNNGTIATANTTTTPLPSGKTWGGTVSYANATGGQTIVSGTYGNLRLEHASGTQSAADSITVTTNFTATGAGSVNLGVYSLKGDPTVAMSSTSTLQTTSTSYTSLPTGKSWDGTVQYNRTSGGQILVSGTFANLTCSNISGTQTAAGPVTVNGTLTTTAGGTLNLNYQTLSGTLSAVVNNGTIRTTASANPPLPVNKTWGGTVVYDSLAGGQNIAYGTYNNLTLSNTSGTHTATAGTITVNGTLTTTSGGTLDLGNNLLALGGSSVIANNGTISTSNTSATSLPSGKTWGGTVSYANTSGGQTVVGGTYTNLTMGNTGGIQTASADLTVNGTLTTTSGGTLHMGNNVLSLGGSSTIANSGTLSTSNTSATPLPSGKTWGGTISYANATGGQTIVAGTYTNLTMGNTSGIQTASTDLTVAGTLLVPANTTLDLGINILQGTLTTISNSGTIQTANTSTTPIPTGRTWTGKVLYKGQANSTQTAVAGSYQYLELGEVYLGTVNAGGAITIASNGGLTTAAASILNLGTNTLSLQTGAALDHNGILTTTNTSTTPISAGFTWNGTVRYASTTGGQRIVQGSYNNLTLSNTSGTQTAGGDITVKGALTTSGTFDLSSNFLDVDASSGSVTNNGTIITSNTSQTQLPLPSGKDWSGAANNGTVVYAQTTGSQQVAPGTYGNLTLSNTSGIQTAKGNLTVGGTLTTTSGGTLDLGNFTLDGTINSIVNNGIISTASTATAPLPSGRTWGGTIAYANTTGGQTVVSGTYTNLILGNGGGVQTVSADLAVTGTLTTTSGGTLDLGTYTFSTAPGTITNNGTISTSNTSAAPLPSGITWGGTIVYGNSTGGQTVVAGTYNNLTLSNASGTQSAAGNFTVNGTFTIGSGSTFNLAGSRLTGNLTPNNSGTITISNRTSNPPIPNGKTWGGTVNYTSISSQNIAWGTYQNLILANGTPTPYTNTATGGLTVDGQLTIGNNCGINMGTNLLSLGTSAVVTNNGTILTTSTVTAPLPENRSWGGTIVYAYTTGGQTIVPGTYNNLTVSNTSGSQTASGSITVTGALTTTSGGTLDLGSNDLSGSLTTVTNNGTIRTNSLSAIPLPSGKTWGGTVVYASSAGGQTIVSGTYNQLTMSNTSAPNTVGGNVTVSGECTFGTKPLAVGSNILSLNGVITNHSAASCLSLNGGSELSLGGSGGSVGLFFDQTTAGVTNKLKNLTVNRSGSTITINNKLQVTGSVMPTAGSINLLDQLTLISDANGTARIGPGVGSSYITGTGSVAVQRYIPSVARRWRFLGSTVQNAALQDYQNEIYITGPSGAANGFDATASNAPSVYSYDETVSGSLNNGWSAAGNINQVLTMGKGYRFFVRGDRSNPGRLTGSVIDQNAVTLDLVGMPYQGDISIPVTLTKTGTAGAYVAANDGWNLVCNPYASPYDWNAHYDNGTFHANLQPTVWILNAQNGGYSSYNAASNGGTLSSGIIPAGAAFWVKANGSGVPSLTFKEQFKVATSPVSLFKTGTGANSTNGFTLTLFADSITSDVATIIYHPNATPNYDSLDISKISGIVTISCYGSDSAMLDLSARPPSTTNDTIRLNVSASAGSYALQFNNTLDAADEVWLHDNYTATATNLTAIPQYPFTITASNPLSQGPSRFYLVVRKPGALPVKLIQFSATPLQPKQVALKWSTSQEVNSEYFEVERSTDNREYLPIAKVRAAGFSQKVMQYDVTDETPGLRNYYRLKQVDRNGDISYSNSVLVEFGTPIDSSFHLYPLPANNRLNVSNATPMQTIRVFDINGILQLQQAGNGKEAVLELDALASGSYVIEVIDDKGNALKRLFIKN